MILKRVRWLSAGWQPVFGVPGLCVSTFVRRTWQCDDWDGGWRSTLTFPFSKTVRYGAQVWPFHEPAHVPLVVHFTPQEQEAVDRLREQLASTAQAIDSLTVSFASAQVSVENFERALGDIAFTADPGYVVDPWRGRVHVPCDFPTVDVHSPECAALFGPEVAWQLRRHCFERKKAVRKWRRMGRMRRARQTRRAHRRWVRLAVRTGWV